MAEEGRHEGNREGSLVGKQKGWYAGSMANPGLSREEASDMVEMANRCAVSMGMHPYYLYRQKNIVGNLENTGYCKPGHESLYNIHIMEERQSIIAMGAGAVTKVVWREGKGIERQFNLKNVEEYIRRAGEMADRKEALLNMK
jgi:oxygen-independent coproporphyrinogen-3 oxidase